MTKGLQKTEQRDGAVGAVRKALEILCEFTAARPSHGVTDLARRLGMPKSTTHNLLRTLESLDFLRQDPLDRFYRLGPRVYELGLRYSQSTHLVSTALPHLKRFAEVTRETVKLAVLSGDEILIVTAIESPYQLHTRGDVGMRAPLHCTGLGKAILAALSTGEVKEIIHRRGLSRLTPHTIQTEEQLLAELERIRAEGYTIDREENESGVICVAATIAVQVDHTVAALSVSGPASRLDAERIREHSKLVIDTARSVEVALASKGGKIR